MTFLDAAAKAELQDRLLKAQKERRESFLDYRERMKEYYEQVLRLESCRDEGPVDWEKELCQGLRCRKAKQIQKLELASQKKTLNALLELKRSSEMVFMSFFHTVSKLLREHGEQPPKPREIMEIQKLLFGCKYVMTCDRNIALLAYTLGLLEEGEIDGFAEKCRERLRSAGEETKCATLEQTGTTTMLFERYLDEESIDDQKSFLRFLDRWSKCRQKPDWKLQLKQCFLSVWKARGWTESTVTVYLEQHGCAHMEDTLRRRVLNETSGEIPQREWFLAFALYMGFRNDEVDQLLRCCGYVRLGFEPWEEGLRYILDNLTDDLRGNLDRRESVFAFLVERGFAPPSTLFASFPYLALQPNKNDHKLLAALLLDCCAEVKEKEAPEGGFYADFYAPDEQPFWEGMGPDLTDLFSPKEGCPNLAAQIRRMLGCTVRMDLPILKRGTQEYENLSQLARNWQKSWKPAVQTAQDEQVMWSLPEECGTDPGFRRKFLYAIFLYIIYTGHLPMKNYSFPANFPRPGIVSSASCLEFTSRDEAEACRNMAASLLWSGSRL